MQGLLRWTIRVLCLGLACLLALMLVRYQKTERARDAHLAQLRKEAAVYETQLKTIQKELDTMKDAVGSENRSGMIMIAFQAQSTHDLERVSDWAEQYAFTPVIVLDLEMQNAERLRRAAAQAEYETVFTAAPFTSESAERAAAAAERSGEDDESALPGLFLLRDAYESDENLALLQSAGFDGCVCYNTHAAFAEAHPEFLLMNYSYLKDSSFSVQKRLNAMSGGGEALMIVLDLSSGALTQEAADGYLSTICGYSADHGLQITTVAQTCEAIRQNRVNTASGQAAYEKLLAERQAEIDALNAKLDEIYSNWKGDHTA